MNDARAVVRVRILGEDYTLRTEASAEHTRAVAEHVDRTIRSIMSGNSTVETQKAAILAALHITDELFRERAGAEAMTDDLRRLASDIRPLLPPALRGEDGGG
ncbi:MAG: cell division protein ZapA [Gemmatimonadetes bacterium]|nr:cell division protein ZapA [Gemmatimonadota bacterium]